MAKFKVYVSDYIYETLKYERDIIVSKLDAEFIPLKCKTDDELIEKARDADALLVQYLKITDKVFENLKNLKIVVRYGVGYDNLDIESAARHGVYACNVPDYGTEEVSTHAMALMLALIRKIVQLNNSVKGGTWNLNIYKPMYRTNKRVLGIVGLGRIGSMMAKKAKAFGFDIIACDPYIDDSVFEKNGVKKVDFDTLLSLSDVISIHTPLNDETYHMFNKDAFSKVKKGVLIVNTSRGPVVDQDALIWGLENNIVGAAALDVCEKEPIEADNRLKTFDNVIITPHAAWYSEESNVDMKVKAAEEIVRVLSGEKPLNSVNKI